MKEKLVNTASNKHCKRHTIWRCKLTVSPFIKATSCLWAPEIKKNIYTSWDFLYNFKSSNAFRKQRYVLC